MWNAPLLLLVCNGVSNIFLGKALPRLNLYSYMNSTASGIVCFRALARVKSKHINNFMFKVRIKVTIQLGNKFNRNHQLLELRIFHQVLPQSLD